MAATATATATASSGGPRYAPDDPTLPKPWRGLVDGKTGYLYFWNPETNVTQYERPAPSSRMSQKPSSTPLSSSVQVQQSSQGQRRDNSDDDDRYGRGSNGAQKLALAGSNNQSARGGSDYSSSVSNGAIGAGHGGSSTRGYGSSVVGSGSSAESYRHRHEITVTGDDVPLPFTSFEATGFPSEILREVRYLLHGGAKCRTLCCPLLGGLRTFGAPLCDGPIF